MGVSPHTFHEVAFRMTEVVGTGDPDVHSSALYNLRGEERGEDGREGKKDNCITNVDMNKHVETSWHQPPSHTSKRNQG